MRDLLRKPEEAVSVLLGIVLFATLLWQVFTRYVLRDPSTMSEEAARYLYVWVVFAGASAAVSTRGHIGMPFVLERFPAGVRLAVGMFTNLLSIVFCAAIVVYGVRAAIREWDLPSVAMEVPTGLVLAAVPLFMGTAAVRLALLIAEDLRDYRRRGEVRASVSASDF